DRLNRLTAHIDGLGAKTAYELAVDGLPLKRTNALGHTYAYDKAGNLIQSADQRSGVLNYIYDKIGRIQVINTAIKYLS
ncbi:MAG: hypothetical protein E6650_09740, partial [Neisseria subflava]|nr:hypothetical protein [Neisseria subflava]